MGRAFYLKALLEDPAHFLETFRMHVLLHVKSNSEMCPENTDAYRHGCNGRTLWSISRLLVKFFFDSPNYLLTLCPKALVASALIVLKDVKDMSKAHSFTLEALARMEHAETTHPSLAPACEQPWPLVELHARWQNSTVRIFPHLSGAVDLMHWERRERSQNGEDGVLEAIFGVIGSRCSCFAEVGAHDGRESNSRHLRTRFGWRGVAFDDVWQNSDINLVRARVEPHVLESLL